MSRGAAIGGEESAGRGGQEEEEGEVRGMEAGDRATGMNPPHDIQQ